MMSREAAGRSDGRNSEISGGGLRRRAESITAFDRSLLDAAKKALAVAGLGALEFLAANPGLSKIELARRLNRGATAIGLVMAVYEEAVRKGAVRDIAKDMLIRVINGRFPDGWSSSTLDNLGPRFKVDGWRLDLLKYGRDPRVNEYALAIVRDLAVDHPPPRFWKPELNNDPFICGLFDRYWPAEPNRAAGQPS
ncbi:MAG: hypothetical protein ABSG86_17000 [Thermoguttaceae bacterium]